MKLILLFIVATLPLTAQSQASVYHPFPESNVVWNWESSNECSTGIVNRFWRSYTIQGDTIINLNSYRKVYIAWDVVQWTCQGITYSNPGNYFGAMRQDTAARTVYFYHYTDSAERLLYDFNLHVGDTVRTFMQSGCWSGDSIISGEDSVLIAGSYRKRWKISVHFGPEYIIEGIGNTSGPFSPVCGWFEGGDVLVCCTQNNVVLFQDSIFTTTPGLCNIMNEAGQQQNQNNFTIYPNPINQTSIIETSEYPCSMEIYNTLGQKVLQLEINNQRAILDRGNLLNGIYFYRATSKNGLLVSDRIIFH